jgi:hypothetical protein
MKSLSRGSNHIVGFATTAILKASGCLKEMIPGADLEGTGAEFEIGRNAV